MNNKEFYEKAERLILNEDCKILEHTNETLVIEETYTPYSRLLYTFTENNFNVTEINDNCADPIQFDEDFTSVEDFANSNYSFC